MSVPLQVGQLDLWPQVPGTRRKFKRHVASASVVSNHGAPISVFCLSHEQRRLPAWTTLQEARNTQGSIALSVHLA